MHQWMRNEIKVNIGLNLIETEQYEQAIEYYTTQIDSDPDNAEWYFWRGRMYRETALTIKRSNGNINTDVSRTYFNNSNDDYRRALDLDTEDSAKSD